MVSYYKDPHGLFNLIFFIAKLCLLIFLFFRAFKTIRNIKKRDLNILSEYDTYCIISVIIVYLLQLLILSIAIWMSITLTFVALQINIDESIWKHVVYTFQQFMILGHHLLLYAIWFEAFVSEQLVKFEKKYTL